MAALCLKDGVLYVGRGAMTARVAAYDLDGHQLDPGFSFRAEDGGRASVSGMSVDDDHRVWIADSASRRLRCFTLFGVEVAGVTAPEGVARDVSGDLGMPVDVLSIGSDDAQLLLVASAGTRRHALQEVPLGAEAGRPRSYRPRGEANGRFRGLSRVVRGGELVYACEPAAGRVQVFRDGDYHFEVRAELPGESFTPRAAVVLPDGRLVIAHARERARLLLVDASGRIRRVLAEHGEEEGSIVDPSDLALDVRELDARTRVCVLDQGGDRVQVFNLDGACYGAFPVLPGMGSSAQDAPR